MCFNPHTGHLQKKSMVGAGGSAERAGLYACRLRAWGPFPGPGVDQFNQSSELLWEAVNSECGKQAGDSVCVLVQQQWGATEDF